ncbi:MAG: translation elongation factor Ts [Candidatus Omnitrophica bacterium]|nr:translation elongation factor Ts [Candidatus Omnitrophota bacterium]
MKISVKDIQKLRERTHAGVMDCKQALQESKGDFDKAIQALRKRGQVIAAKKSSRQAKEGRIASYVHLNHKIGVLVEINCETDFVSRCADFKDFSKDLTMQIAALNPVYIKKEDVPKDVVKEHKDQIEEFYKANCLLEQPFVKDQSKTIKDYLMEIVAKIGENIVIRRFVRFQLGEEV